MGRVASGGGGPEFGPERRPPSRRDGSASAGRAPRWGRSPRESGEVDAARLFSGGGSRIVGPRRGRGCPQTPALRLVRRRFSARRTESPEAGWNRSWSRDLRIARRLGRPSVSEALRAPNNLVTRSVGTRRVGPGASSGIGLSTGQAGPEGPKPAMEGGRSQSETRGGPSQGMAAVWGDSFLWHGP